jgi:hypothetical protein
MAILVFLISAFLGTAAFGQISDVFRDPEKACRLLEPEGFSAGKIMFHPHGFECSTAMRNKENESPARFDFSGITYSVSGESIHRVSRIKLVVELGSGYDPTRIMGDFQKLSEIVLKGLGIELPKDLTTAMSSTRYRRWLQKTGSISLDPGGSPHTTRVLAIRHPSIRVVPIPRAAAARSSN